MVEMEYCLQATCAQHDTTVGCTRRAIHIHGEELPNGTVDRFRARYRGSRPTRYRFCVEKSALTSRKGTNFVGRECKLCGKGHGFGLLVIRVFFFGCPIGPPKPIILEIMVARRLFLVAPGHRATASVEPWLNTTAFA